MKMMKIMKMEMMMIMKTHGGRKMQPRIRLPGNIFFNSDNESDNEEEIPEINTHNFNLNMNDGDDINLEEFLKRFNLSSSLTSDMNNSDISDNEDNSDNEY